MSACLDCGGHGGHFAHCDRDERVTADTACECGHNRGCHDDLGNCWHMDSAGDEDCDCDQFRQPAPSAGQDTDDRRCGRCGQIPYAHGLPDSTCVYEPTEAAGQDTERLRDERPDVLGRPAVLSGDVRSQVREAIRRELIAWGYSQEAADSDPRRLPVESLSTDLTGAVLRLDIVRAALDPT